MKFVLNNSAAGKGAQDYLKNSLAKSQQNFVDKEKELKKNEKDLLEKKTILTKEEYTKKTNELRKKVMEYQSDRKSVLAKITQQRAESRKVLLEKLNPIIRDYIKENNISLVFDKSSIVAGSNVDLDITDTIVEMLNKELPSLKLN